MCQTFDTCQSDRLPLLCRSLIRWSGLHLLLTERWECPISTLLSPKHCSNKLSHRRTAEYNNSTIRKDQGHTDWLPGLWWVCVLSGSFSSVTCCINIAVQTSLRAIWLESQSTSVELTCENSQLCRCLCHWPTVLLSPTPTVGEGIEFQIYTKALRLILLSSMQQELSLPTVPSQFPKWSRAGRVGFHTSNLSCLSDLGAAHNLGRNTPLAYGVWLRGGWVS